MSTLENASNAQIQAANPVQSTWVSANAGSGKTRVLTNRVARLLLAGCAPQKILCLTYTKAAAAEMQNRLFERLGAWAMKSDDDLRAELENLGETALDADQLHLARTLFARALETPGGLKIQTIHAFCGAILRRFPLESGVSPQFQEMEDRQAKQLCVEIIEAIAADQGSIFDAMAWQLSGDDMEGLLGGILKHRAGFAKPFDTGAVAQALRAEVGLSDTAILAGVMHGFNDAEIDRLAHAMAAGGKADIALSQGINTRKGITATQALDLYETLYLTQKGTPRAPKGFPVVAVIKANPWVPEILEELKSRMVIAREQRLALKALKRAEALHGFAQEFLRRYDKRKAALGRLDFEDLIQKTLALLTKTNMAAWVLYRLDGGINHILVDEAQDTAPAQWEIVRILAEEFYTGAQDRETPRTIFVVGDEKQSIYSFQGADPLAFGAMRRLFLDRLENVAQTLHKTELLYSFRSAAPVLQLVDKVFTGDAREGLEGDIVHCAVWDDLPGKVELWPFVEAPEKPQENPWHLPVDSVTPDDPRLKLATAIATQIAGLIGDRHVLPGGNGRAVSPGDFLILVQSRNLLFHAIIKALKAAGVDVAGADRLKIIEEMAVKDLLALLQFLATPEDDLSLAAALRSPLFGLSEQDIYTLAEGRNGTLWQALTSVETHWPEVVNTLKSLRNDADFIRPYDLLERILTGFDGRRKLTARLGAEAEDGIDELLTQSLRYESVEAPLLTGFLGWISSDDVEVKRQMDAAGDRVRVMTVHGAKGLESPIVILPDTTKRQESRHPPQVVMLDDLPVWKTVAAVAPEALVATEDARRQLVREESRRLLYVALTRAKNWLIICGAGTQDKDGDSWFQRIETALAACNALPMQAPKGLAGPALMLEHNWHKSPGIKAGTAGVNVAKTPEYLHRIIKQPARAQKLISPSKLGGMHVLSAKNADKAEAAQDRGNHIHKLLEILPNIPKPEWEKHAQLVCNEDWQAIYTEVQTVLENPALSAIFAPNILVEVPITANIDALDGQRILGRIDRLVVLDDRVLAVDFKSHRAIPKAPEDTPDAILRQMGAYGAALTKIYPARRIETAIIWTYRAELMMLPEKITQNALTLAPMA